MNLNGRHWEEFSITEQEHFWWSYFESRLKLSDRVCGKLRVASPNWLKLFDLPAGILPKKPRSICCEADDIKGHSDHKDQVCNGAVKQIVIAVLAVGFGIISCLTTQQNEQNIACKTY